MIVPRLARRGIKCSQKLGPHRWVVEHIHACLDHSCRLPIRYDLRSDINETFTGFAASRNQIKWFC